MTAVWLAGWQSTGLGGADDPSIAELRAHLDHELAGGWALTVAEVDGRVIGMLATHDAKLRELFLDPEWEGRGIGKALFAEAKRLLPGGFTLWANTANTRARGFYERQGMAFEGLGPRPDKAEQVVAHYRWSPD